MNLRVNIYDKLVGDCLLIQVVDLDNEGRAAMVKIFISKYIEVQTIEVSQVLKFPLDVIIPHSPMDGKVHEVTAKIYDKVKQRLHDTDTRFVKLGIVSKGKSNIERQNSLP